MTNRGKFSRVNTLRRALKVILFYAGGVEGGSYFGLSILGDRARSVLQTIYYAFKVIPSITKLNEDLLKFTGIN